MHDHHQVCKREQMEQTIILISNNILVLTSISECQAFFISGFQVDMEAINKKLHTVT
jgi:hypothetical protein